MPGYWYGYKQHLVCVNFALKRPSRRLRERLAAFHTASVAATKRDLLPDIRQASWAGQDRTIAVEYFAALVVLLQNEAGGVVVESPLLLKPDDCHGQVPDTYRLVLPCQNPRIGMEAVRAAIRLVQGLPTDQKIAPALVKENLRKASALLHNFVPGGTNAGGFVRAAYDLDIPHILLPENVLQFGLGFGARWFKSSISEDTPQIAVQWSKSKAASSIMLNMAGFPVPRQAVVRNEGQLVQFAERFGYPVVLKPKMEDQGRGVCPGIPDAKTLLHVYRTLCTEFKDLVVEKQHDGTEYRINIVSGTFYNASRRVPAGVDGDGVHTIEQLIARQNKDLQRSNPRHSAQKPIQIDDELSRCLAAQELDLDHVPPKGERIRLRYAANISTGGYTVEETEQVCPENQALFTDVAQFLKLDYAGIDFMCEDISRLFSDQDCVIIEVNAQPQMGVTRKEIWRVILTETEAPACFPVVSARLGSAGEPGRGSWNGFTREKVRRTLKTVEIAIDEEVLRKGLPFPKVHALYIVDWNGSAEALELVLRNLTKHLAGPVFIGEDHDFLPLVRRWLPDLIAVSDATETRLQDLVACHVEKRLATLAQESDGPR